MKYVPNLLSFARLAMSPYVFLLLWRRQYGAVLLLFGVAAVTDFLDGYLARSIGVESRVGAYLDPVADKVLLGGSFLTLALTGAIDTWMAVLVIGRDAAILLFAGGAFLFSASMRSFPPSGWGKASTAAQIAFVIAVVAHFAGLGNGLVVLVLQGVVAALTVWSGVDYGWRALAPSRT